MFSPRPQVGAGSAATATGGGVAGCAGVSDMFGSKLPHPARDTGYSLMRLRHRHPRARRVGIGTAYARELAGGRVVEGRRHLCDILPNFPAHAAQGRATKRTCSSGRAPRGNEIYGFEISAIAKGYIQRTYNGKQKRNQ